jgi:hypothetical protein
VTLKGVDRWRCKTSGTDGTGCGPDVPWDSLDPEVVASQENTTAKELGENDPGDAHAIGDIGKNIRDTFGVGPLQDTVVAIFMGLIVKIGVGLLFFGVVWVFNRYRNSLPCEFLHKVDPLML